MRKDKIVENKARKIVKFAKVSEIKDETLQDLEFYTAHGCGD